METSNTRRLFIALGRAKAGTTIEIAAVCDFARFPELELDVSVRLIGRGRGIKFCSRALEVSEIAFELESTTKIAAVS